jgi:zinc transporter ZupT
VGYLSVLQEMNTPDLAALLTFLMCGIASCAASHSAGAPIWVTVVVTVLGLCFGFFGGTITRMTTYKLYSMQNRGLLEIVVFLISMMMPVLGVIIFGGITIASITYIMKFVGYEPLR